MMISVLTGDDRIEDSTLRMSTYLSYSCNKLFVLSKINVNVHIIYTYKEKKSLQLSWMQRRKKKGVFEPFSGGGIPFSGGGVPWRAFLGPSLRRLGDRDENVWRLVSKKTWLYPESYSD